MIIHNCVTTRSEITHIKAFNDNLIAYSTKLHGIKFYSIEDEKIILNISSEYLNSQTSAISFSSDTQHVAIANNEYIYILHMPSRKLLKKISTNGDHVDILSFDISSMYIIAGTKDGRVLQYRYNESSLLSRLCSFPTNRMNIKKNFISAFAFYENKIASSGLGGSIIIVDLHSLSSKKVLTPSIKRTNALCFLDKDTIISGNVDGIIHVNSLQNKNFHEQINAPFINIKQILLMPNPQYIMVIGDSNLITLVDIKNYKIARINYIELQDTVNMIALLNEETIVIALKSNKIVHVSLPSIKKLNSLVVNNILDEAFLLVENEPMLIGSKEYKELKSKFDKIYLKAIKALIAQDKKLAFQITDIFKDIPSLKEKIQLLFKAFEHYPRFQILCSQQKLSLAYAMAQKYPALEHTWQYIRMEEAWKNAFKAAQKQVLQGNIQNAKLYLNVYATVLSKKELIQLILKHNSDFISFLKAIEKNDFYIVEQLASKYSLFKETQTYISLNHDIDYNIKKAKQHIERGDNKSANRYLQKIKNIPKTQQEFKILSDRCEKTLQIKVLYEENNFISCYEMIDTHTYLASIELGLLLEKHWSKLIHKCEKFALKGNIKDIKLTLGELLLLKTRRNKIGDLLRVSFHARIKILIVKKAFKQAETIIYSYIDIFGFDKEIQLIMKFFEIVSSSKLAISYSKNHKPSRDAWIHSKVIILG